MTDEEHRLRAEMMRLRLELRHYQEFIEFSPSVQPLWKEYEERLRTPVDNRRTGDVVFRLREEKRIAIVYLTHR